MQHVPQLHAHRWGGGDAQCQGPGRQFSTSITETSCPEELQLRPEDGGQALSGREGTLPDRCWHGQTSTPPSSLSPFYNYNIRGRWPSL